MATINGNVKWGIIPLGFSNYEIADMAYNFRANYLKSVNTPMRYQVIWQNGSMNEAQEPSSDGDIVNVIFDIEETVDNATWFSVASIKKAKDIPNKHYLNGNAPNGHRFTIDISNMCQDLLSYSLVPIGKGTWQDYRFGGLNGGAVMQDNVTENISSYNVSRNGSFRTVRVKARFEVLDSNNNIVIATNTLSQTPSVIIINSAPTYSVNDFYYNDRYVIDETTAAGKADFGFMSNCPNFSDSQLVSSTQPKLVRMNEEAEWLYWFQRKSAVGASGTSQDLLSDIRLLLKTDDKPSTSFYIKEFNDTLDFGVNNGTANTYNTGQNRLCVQNVSPAYINENNGTTYTNVTDSGGAINVTTYPDGIVDKNNTNTYRVYLQYIKFHGGTDSRHTHYRHFKIDRESENVAYKNVRFHWLNRVGGIDSYTAKRDVVEGLSISRSTIERKTGDGTWLQNQYNQGTVMNGSIYKSNTMRGGNFHKGGVEVMNVNANRNLSVFTEPLNTSTAKWLEEIMTSPNVWVEMETDATEHNNEVNPYQRPSKKDYIPVIITNGDIEVVNQEAGLVKFNIEYTMAHKINTQRN